MGDQGHLYVIGLGPGARQAMTGQALEALRQSQVVIGYTGYFASIADLVAGKECLAAGAHPGGVERAPPGSRAVAPGPGCLRDLQRRPRNLCYGGACPGVLGRPKLGGRDDCPRRFRGECRRRSAGGAPRARLCGGQLERLAHAVGNH